MVRGLHVGSMTQSSRRLISIDRCSMVFCGILFSGQIGALKTNTGTRTKKNLYMPKYER